MRVVCSELDEFVTNLRLEPASCVLQQSVRISVTTQPIDGSKHDASRFRVTFHASAVVELEGGGQYLLDCGVDCGVDYRDASQEMLGTAQAEALRAKLVEFCDDYGLKVRPGIIEA